MLTLLLGIRRKFSAVSEIRALYANVARFYCLLRSNRGRQEELRHLTGKEDAAHLSLRKRGSSSPRKSYVPGRDPRCLTCTNSALAEPRFLIANQNIRTHLNPPSVSNFTVSNSEFSGPQRPLVRWGPEGSRPEGASRPTDLLFEPNGPGVKRHRLNFCRAAGCVAQHFGLWGMASAMPSAREPKRGTFRAASPARCICVRPARQSSLTRDPSDLPGTVNQVKTRPTYRKQTLSNGSTRYVPAHTVARTTPTQIFGWSGAPSSLKAANRRNVLS